MRNNYIYCHKIAGFILEGTGQKSFFTPGYWRFHGYDGIVLFKERDVIEIGKL
jgi:hypothetical protein